MANAVCRHKWEMKNVRAGYLVIEGCYHCRNRISFFSEEAAPPIDDYQEGEHFWSHLADYQATQFDLKCEACGDEVSLKDVMALMLCMRCSPDCRVYRAAESPGKMCWVYVALCPNTSHAPKKCIPEKSIRALNEYFNQGSRDSMKNVVVVPCSMRKSVDFCQGIVLADYGLTELY